jgi:hypothetical protein
LRSGRRVVKRRYDIVQAFSQKKGEQTVSGETRPVTERVKLDAPWSHEFAQDESFDYNDRSLIYCSLRAKLYILQNDETKFAKNRKSHFSNFLYLAEKLYMEEIKAIHNEDR